MVFYSVQPLKKTFVAFFLYPKAVAKDNFALALAPAGPAGEGFAFSVSAEITGGHCVFSTTVNR